ncbi:MAG: MoxR family ATPase [Lachnospiraceae bacterium]|uniref:AAA family ATPase n=1 Tax=Roseburia hominis TaxID=301301 RepID=UPI001F462933|nr:MoxR family ATPase [Roseburia hominis]MCI5713448.1 MoxR family ATPase [Lachnospiraceae bacterium]MDD6169976.1 MoxR family ATPase [Lachnospiraceae bacterium]
MSGVLAKIKENVEKVMIGKGEVIDLLLTSLVAGGHVLLEDVPGTGKTVLAKSLAKSMDFAFGRVQFTPDLLPSDVTGLSYYNAEKSAFVFKEGPVFTNLLLADEINRATPRTQSSLLECMAEGQVTVDGVTRKLEQPFFVIATQNPVETLGCYPLPEAQMDRFLMKISMGSLSAEEERRMIDRYIVDEPLAELTSVCTLQEIKELQKQCREVFVHNDLRDYIVALIQGTRNMSGGTAMGVSPRGTLAFLHASQGYALVQGRNYVVPEDIKKVAIPVLVHRLISETGEEAEKAAVIENLLNSIPLPTEDWTKA